MQMRESHLHQTGNFVSTFQYFNQNKFFSKIFLLILNKHCIMFVGTAIMIHTTENVENLKKISSTLNFDC